MEPTPLFTPEDMLPEKDAFELEIKKDIEISQCTGIVYSQLPNIRVQFLFYPVDVVSAGRVLARKLLDSKFAKGWTG